MRWGRRAIVAVAAALSLAGVGSVLAVGVANQHGYSVVGMKTGSMAPTVNPGDLVVAESLRPADVRVGDMITFRAPYGTHPLYTHRVVRITYSAAGVAFTTKGDGNRIADPWQVRYADGRAWRVVRVLRNASLFLLAVQSPTGRDVMAGSVFVVMLALTWPGISRRPEAG